jgi:hypothetical protein
LTRTAVLLAIAGLLAALLFAAAAEGGEARPPRPGFWESAPLTPRGEAASIVVRRSGRRTVVTAISAPTPPCRDLFGIFGEPGSPLPSLPVDRRGRFAGARGARTDGIAAVSGRFLGARPGRATLRAAGGQALAARSGSSGCDRYGASRSPTAGTRERTRAEGQSPLRS